LESLQAVQPDLLILDTCLPDKHGIDVLSRVRHIGQGFPILILSALAAPSAHQVLSRAQLLHSSGSLVFPGQTRTIDVRLSRLRRLLRNLTGADLILPERGQGYKLNVEVRPVGVAAQILPTS